jgi:hypothetical protein
MCPPADFPICLVGTHPFVGLCGLVTSGEHVVLLSKSSETQRAQSDHLRYLYYNRHLAKGIVVCQIEYIMTNYSKVGVYI